ncbi:MULTISPECIES: hypothetical protein [Cyanophyceae]|uniref:hypothetical protein n=1 Tax=Cyanophyceae TaxID=3028117 RepID=UPI001687C632|nr:hypothetical protein [Trichocoleus sp. FACHB-40]MBD2006981.1 hypothetical protein [Trichocoleus sp. FACHB-40]
MMYEDLELARFILDVRWRQLVPTGAFIERHPSGVIALTKIINQLCHDVGVSAVLAAVQGYCQNRADWQHRKANLSMLARCC